MSDPQRQHNLNEYNQNKYEFFKRLRLLFLVGQCAQSVFITWISWDLTEQSSLVFYFVTHQLMVLVSLYIYHSPWTNARISDDGLPMLVREVGFVTMAFAGSALWVLPKSGEMLALATSMVYFASAAATILMGPLRNFARLAITCFLLPHGMACFWIGHYSIGSMVLVFLAIIAVGAVEQMGKFFDELVGLRLKSKEDATELQEELRKREMMEKERRELQRELLLASRMAGKAEIATGVLHNIGNVMNSVNLATTTLRDDVEREVCTKITRCIELLSKHEDDLGTYFSNDKKAVHFLPFMRAIESRQEAMLTELDDLVLKVQHVNSVVSAQQSHASAKGCSELANINDVIEEALQIVSESVQRHQIEIRKDYAELEDTPVDRHRMIQILVNLFHNAKNAIDDANPEERAISITTTLDSPEQQIVIEVRDTGIGIEKENLTKIFQHGYSGRKHKGGFGFGLHHSVNSAREVGWQLNAESKGRGEGALFRLQISTKVAEPVSR